MFEDLPVQSAFHFLVTIRFDSQSHGGKKSRAEAQVIAREDAQADALTRFHKALGAATGSGYARLGYC